jgi:membrane protein
MHSISQAIRAAAIHVGRTLWRAIRHWQEDDGFVISAAMAYYVSLALFPLTLVLIAVFGAVVKFSPVIQAERTQFLDGVGQAVSPWLAEQLGRLLSGIEDRAATSGPLGLALLALTALGMFVQFDQMVDRLWRKQPVPSIGWTRKVRNWLLQRLTAFLMLLGCGLLLVSSIVARVGLTTLGAHMAEWADLHAVIGGATWLLTVGLQAGAFTVIYKALPPERVPWRHAAAGGLAAATLWDVGQRLLTMFLIGQKFTAYGVVGVFLAVMLWMYYASAAVFLGLELVWVLVDQLRSSGPTATASPDRDA